MLPVCVPSFMQVRQSTPGTSLALVQVDYNGVTSLDLTLNNSLTPDLAAYLTTTPVPQGLTMPNSSSVFVVPVIAPTPTPPAADTGGGGGGLEPWQVSVMCMACMSCTHSTLWCEHVPGFCGVGVGRHAVTAQAPWRLQLLGDS